MKQLQTGAGADWWRGAVIYQIYPRSFQDSNGDGIGDLQGITQRLDHVSRLGADAVWISPVFTSPMKDYGYDISDYCDIDPIFGTLADFDAMLSRAHNLGLRVMIDLVLSHTSRGHPWFRESRRSRTGPMADWYVWADPKPDGTPPNNWLSIFGGTAWHWEARREQYYLHNFLMSQPDLNFHCPAVQDALLNVARFWLDRGVDGFRLDVINFYAHDKELRDNPPLPPEERNAKTAPAVNPYNHQNHIYDKTRPETIEFLKKLREVMEPYGAAAVGEVGESQRGLEVLGEYTRGNDRVQMSYAFEFLSGSDLTAGTVAEVFTELDRVAADGWVCWAFSNHDVVRHVTRWTLSPAAAKAYATLLMTIRGSVCIYQGEELGLPEAEISFEDLHDPYGREFWPEYKGRDGCRTPMIWRSDHATGDFSTQKPWLPVPPEHLPKSVAAQADDQLSLMVHYRNAIALRHAHPALTTGAQTDMKATGEIISFIRSDETERVFVAINLSEIPSTFRAPEGNWTAIAAELGAASKAGPQITLAPWQSAVLVERTG